MASLRESRRLIRYFEPHRLTPLDRSIPRKRQCNGFATTSTKHHDQSLELEESSVTRPGPTEDIISSFDPVKQSKQYPGRLPSSRYKYRPPRYNRGPLHPHQSPLASDPASREFVPGPFTLPRFVQQYDSTLASDMLAMCYTHIPEGQPSPQPKERLRSWVGDSPYFAGRSLRGPRGSAVLRPLQKPTTFRNIPAISRVTVHAMAPEASSASNSAWLHVAGMIVQAITGKRTTAHKARHNVPGWGLKTSKFISVTAELKGEDMAHFLSKLIDVVLPRFKEWKGVKGTSGDSTGNISFGLRPVDVALFPEVEVNFDMYPPKMIPGAYITIHTSATSDREARLLLSSIGLPFYGKFVN